MFDPTDWGVGFWLFTVIDVIAVAVLAAAIIYGNRMWGDRPKDSRTVKAAGAAPWEPYQRTTRRHPRIAK